MSGAAITLAVVLSLCAFGVHRLADRREWRWGAVTGWLWVSGVFAGAIVGGALVVAVGSGIRAGNSAIDAVQTVTSRIADAAQTQEIRP